MCHVYCWLVEESRRLSLSCLWGRDGERPGIWDKRLGGYVSFLVIVFFRLALVFSARAFDIGGFADAVVVNIHAMSSGKDLG